MSRYQVPQFIEVESKVFGPLTIRQFLYLVGGGGVVFIFSLFLPLILWMLLGIPVVGFAIALAFYKVNNRPFLSVVTSALRYYSSTKLFLWQKEKRQEKAVPQNVQPLYTPYAPRFTRSRLRDLSWSLDVRGTERR